MIQAMLHVRRPWLMAVWLGLLVVGCMSQMTLIQGPPGNGESPAAHLVKSTLDGQGTWTRAADGSANILVQLHSANAGLPFRIAKTDLNAIASVQAGITASDIATPIRPNQSNVTGTVAVSNGIMPALSFPPVPSGTKRILTVQGLNSGGGTVPGALIKTLFDINSNTGSFEVSYKTTPAAQVYEGLGTATRLAMSAADLNMMANAITVPGAAGVYSGAHPTLVRTAAIITVLNANGGQILPITTAAATYRDPGAKVTFDFALPQSGTGSDLPQLFSTDPATEVLDLAAMAPSAAAATYTTPQGTVTATIDAARHVTVTFDRIPAGTWKTGAHVPGDGSSPNPNYYLFNGRCGQVAAAIVSTADATGAVTLSPFTGTTYAACEPKFAIGEIRWLKTSIAGGRQVQDVSGNLAATLLAVAPAQSTDFTFRVGKRATPYTFGTSADLSASTDVQVIGEPGAPEAVRPRLMFSTGTTLTLNTPGDALKDVRVSGASVAMLSGGAVQHVTLDGARMPTGTGAALSASGGNCTIAGVHIYDVRHTANPPSGTTKLAGIMMTGSAGGTIDNCLIDDNFGNGGAVATAGNVSVRFDVNGGSGDVAGILVDGTGFTSIANCNVVAMGRVTGSGVTTSDNVQGITGSANAGPNLMVRNCTVSNVEANVEATGISIVAGTVAGCTVESILLPATGVRQVTGIRIGNGTSTNPVTAVGNTLQNLGETNPTTPGTALTAIKLIAPNLQAASAKAGNNTIRTSGAAEFVGIGLGQASTPFNSVLEVHDNQILNNKNLDIAGTSFTGIGGSTALSPNQVTIKHNDITNNSGFNTVYGIRTTFTATGATPHGIAGNRISNNSLGSTTTSNASQAFYMIDAQGTGTCNYVLRDNLIQTNHVIENTGLSQSVAFYGIRTNGTNKTVRNNQVNGNVFDGSSNDTYLLTMLNCQGNGLIHANRIFNNAPSAGLLASTGTEFKGITGNAGLSGTFVERNILADTAFGKHANWYAIYLPSPAGATATLRHNSILVGDNLSHGVLVDNGGLATFVNNALSCQAASGTGSGFTRSATSASDLSGGNWVSGWPTALFNFGAATQLSPATLTTGTVFGVSDATVNVGAHLMGVTGSQVGHNGGIIGAQGTVSGVLPLDPAPVF